MMFEPPNRPPTAPLATAEAAPAAIGPEQSSAATFLDLFVRPSRFFAAHAALARTPLLLLVCWVYGMANVIDRIGFETAKAQSRGYGASFARAFGDDWLIYWAWVMGIGVADVALVWLLGGWWYRKRLGFAGVASPDKRTAKVVYLYASFVWAAPALLSEVAVTLRYPNYLAASKANTMWSLLLVVPLFWSFAVSYRGVRAVFPVDPRKARLWFLILPCVTGVIAIVATFGVLMALLLSEGRGPAQRLGAPSVGQTPASQGKKKAARHALVVEFKYGLKDLGPLREVEDRLDTAIKSASVGEYDGDEIATNLSDGFLYMYGPDADGLFAVVRRVLESAPFMWGAVVRVRYGPPGSRETKVTISGK